MRALILWGETRLHARRWRSSGNRGPALVLNCYRSRAGLKRRRLFCCVPSSCIPPPSRANGAVDRLLSNLISGSLASRCQISKRHRDDQPYHLRKYGLRRGIFEVETSRHMSPALIFDEFEERPFTENRRWRDSDLKIHTHPQTATDFVGLNAIVTPVCRSGQLRVCKLS